MDPKFLTQLAVIVELGSVTKAAKKLNVTQPTLSRTIKVIENWVGGAVLRRGRYGVTPTDIGMQLSEEGRIILQHSEDARAMILEWRNGLGGELRVGVGPILAATIMGDFIMETLASPPNYRLNLHSANASRLVDLLRNEQLDVALIPYDLISKGDALFREVLFEDHLAVFVSQNDPLVGKKNVSPQALADHQWIAIGDSSGLLNTTREMLDSLGLADVTPNLEIAGNDTLIFRILEKTKACCIFPRRQLSLYREHIPLAPIDLSTELTSRNFALWTTMRGRDRPEVVEFLERLNAYLIEVGLR